MDLGVKSLAVLSTGEVIANARRDGSHKLSTRLVGEHGVIVIEDLNVSGMMRNRSLARHVAGVGMAELRPEVECKATWSGVQVHIADRWFPSSKTCSGCGVVKAKLRLSERAFHCHACGLVLDRDLNAARNLAALVERETSSPSCGARLNEPDGNLRKTAPWGAAGTATRRSESQRQRGNALTGSTNMYVLPAEGRTRCPR
ncbi:RNA-guided endonuclease TnpB family protein [Saccharopolyspora sp. NPDC002376]